jgi:hypothetical protein
MKLVLRSLAVLGLVGAFAATAGANGSPYSPGLVYGWPGVRAGDSGTHLVAFSMPKSTIVAAVRARDGRVLRQNLVRGSYNVPMAAGGRQTSARRSAPPSHRDR